MHRFVKNKEYFVLLVGRVEKKDSIRIYLSIFISAPIEFKRLAISS